MMTYKAIRAAMRKAGFPVVESSNRRLNQIRAMSPTHELSWYEDGDSAQVTDSILVKRHGEQDDPCSDYFPGSYMRTIKSAVSMAQRG